MVEFDANFAPLTDVAYSCMVWEDCFQCSRTSNPQLNIPKIDLQTRFGELASSSLEAQENGFAPLLHCICSFTQLQDNQYAIRLHTKTNPFHTLAAVDDAVTHAFIELDYGTPTVSPLKFDEQHLLSLSLQELLHEHSNFISA